MNASLGIRFSKKDWKVIEWLTRASEKGVNISRIIVLAVLYYDRTGRCLKIGSAAYREDRTYKEKYVSISYPEPFARWIATVKENGSKPSTQVKWILNVSIIEGDETTVEEMSRIEQAYDFTFRTSIYPAVNPIQLQMDEATNLSSRKLLSEEEGRELTTAFEEIPTNNSRKKEVQEFLQEEKRMHDSSNESTKSNTATTAAVDLFAKLSMGGGFGPSS